MACSNAGMNLRGKKDKPEEEEKALDEGQAKKCEAKKPKKRVKAKPLFDSRGVHIGTQLDLCDCMNKNCGGCFMPCPKCSSDKCGHECRVNRTWTYSQTEIEGTGFTIKTHYDK